MAKILFSDLDGTLINKSEAISQKNIDAMLEMQKQGHLIALCTGRNHIDIQPVIHNIHIPYDYLVLCNGSYIEDKAGNILFEEHISKEIGMEVIRYLLNNKDIVIMFCDDDGCPILIDGETKLLGLGGLIETDQDFYQLLDKAKRFYMLSIHYKDLSVDKIKEVAKDISNKFPQIETHLNQQYVDIAPKGHSKGTGVRKLLSILNHNDKAYAIGDSFNDLPMITEKDVVGVTFNYALEEIKEKADKVVQYVYELIEEDILEKKI